MKKLLAMLCACLLLTGCSGLLEREYSTAEPHSSKFWESEAAGTLRAESEQDIVNDLLILIGRHTEEAVVRLYGFGAEAAAAEALERAAGEVRQETPMGAYAVEYIATVGRAQRGYYEAAVRIGYRRTAEQIQSVASATGVVALDMLLETALESGRTELAVRLAYWGPSDAQRVSESVERVREKLGLADTPPWTVTYYPSPADAGLIEFIMVPEAPEH